ncbi:MAG: 2TM domain-containing protein [Flavisolibacter sp.]
MKESNDARLWQEAKGRAAFKAHLATYIVVNVLLWLVWLTTQGIHSYPWPIWPTAGWGIGVISNYFSVYRFSNSAEKEYEKLKKSRSSTGTEV